MTIGRFCLNWKVVAGLLVVGLGILVVSPSLALTALPLLLVAACPISMLLMMRGMGGRQCAPQSNQTNEPARGPRSRDDQLAMLQAQLDNLRTQSAALVDQITKLEHADESTSDAARPHGETESFDLAASTGTNQTL